MGVVPGALLPLQIGSGDQESETPGGMELSAPGHSTRLVATEGPAALWNQVSD